MNKIPDIDFANDNENIKNALTLLETSDACLWYINKDYKLIAFNKIFTNHMMAYTNIVPQIGDKDIILDHFPKDFSDRIGKMYKTALKGEIAKSIEKGFNADGSDVDIIMIFKPIFNDHKEVTGIVCLRRDISEYIFLKEQLDEKNEKMKHITWQQSHIVRGPLSTAMGIAKLLEDRSMLEPSCHDECMELIKGLNSKLAELDKVVRKIIIDSEEFA